jgi:hydrogenase expression/formation protein HypE
MAHGSGGKKTSELIDNIFIPAFSNNELNRLNDGAYLMPGKGKIVFSTDSFVVKPLFFPGGDIGKLAVCGTVNDISVCGGTPLYLSLAFIIEEGLAISGLKRIVDSIRVNAGRCGVKIVTGDTKVVERGLCDGVYINTSGIGIADENINLGTHRIVPGDKIIISGTVGDHGLAVMAAREKLFEGGSLKSDCAPVNELVRLALEFKKNIKIMRDPTRGGLATTLKEFVEKSTIGIKIYNDLIPVKSEVQGACDILGIDPLYAANEGKLIVVASSETAEYVVDRLKSNELGRDAAVIGEVVPDAPGRLLLDTGLGSVRIIDKLSGAQLPHIC